MRDGDFARAWDIADHYLSTMRSSVVSKHQGPRHLQRIWRGEPLRGRVLVRCYHGLGDTIQFARFLAPLRAVAADEVILWCQPELLSLMADVEGVGRVLGLHEGDPEVDFDVDIEIMEIPHAMRATRAQVEMNGPYLRAKRRDRFHQAARSRPLSVGLVWEVGDWDRRRAVPPNLLKQLNCPDVRLYSLQRGHSSASAGEMGIIDVSTPSIDLLADRLQMLDLCICPDTMVAHLSAALGCETWIMLHADCDWRWPSGGDKTLWYPTVRLFRQVIQSDWSGVVADIRSALLEKTKSFRSDPVRFLRHRIESSDVSAGRAVCRD
jgi:hypothetical protein